MQINEVTYAGFLGKDAEFFSTEKGMGIATLTIANTYKGKDGKESTTWLKVKCFGNWAKEAQAFQKGDNVIVTGRLNENKWEDKATGKPRSTLELVANQVGVLKRVSEAPKPQQRTQKVDPNFNEFEPEIPF